MFFRYDRNYWYYIPLIAGEKLFLGIEEGDFLLNGYVVRRFKDLRKVQIKDDICREILRDEGIIDGITTPEVDLSGWETVFQSLQKRDQNIIIQNESLDDDACEFAIGRIEKVCRKSVYFRHFDADGIWQPAPYNIPYSGITSVTFASRYVDVISRHLGPLPDNFGR